MNRTEGYFNNGDTGRIYYQAWLPDTPVRAVLVVVHGLSEHSGRYIRLARHFVPQGYGIYGFDHTGHGRSEGRRQHVEHFAQFTDTLQSYCNKVKGWQAGVPLFLFSHSMGGLVACHYLLAGGEATGVVFSAPCIKAYKNITPATVWLGQWLAVVAPRFRLLGIDRRSLSRDPAVLAACANDPLMCQGPFTVRLGVELLAAMHRIKSQAQKITVPFIVLQGSADRIVDPGGAQWLYANAGSVHKTLKIYPGLYHEVLHEPEQGQVLQDVQGWLQDFG